MQNTHTTPPGHSVNAGFGHGGIFLKAAADTTDPGTFVPLRAVGFCLLIYEMRCLAGLLKINVI